MDVLNIDALNVVDWIILGLCLLGAIWGAIKGFIDDFSQKNGYVAGFVFALMFTGKLSPAFVVNLNFPVWVGTLVSYVLIFVVSYLLTKMLGGILKEIIKKAGLNWIDNVAGLFLGFAEAVVFIALFEALLFRQPFFDTQTIRNSFFTSKFISPLTDGFIKLVSGKI